jgi:hypothetical protein
MIPPVMTEVLLPGYRITGQGITSHKFNVPNDQYGLCIAEYETRVLGCVDEKNNIAYLLSIMSTPVISSEKEVPSEEAHNFIANLFPTPRRILAYSRAMDGREILTGTLNFDMLQARFGPAPREEQVQQYLLRHRPGADLTMIAADHKRFTDRLDLIEDPLLAEKLVAVYSELSDFYNTNST